MTDKNHNIVFNGDIVEGFSIGQVKKNMSQLFKTDPEKIATLFGGQRAILKKNIDQTTALKYKQVLLKAGALVDIQLGNAQPTITAAQTQQTVSATTNSTAPKTNEAQTTPQEKTDWSIAPAGSELLADNERKSFKPLNIDLKHISMVSAFANTEPEQKPTPDIPDTTQLSVAEVGATIGEGSLANTDIQAPIADLNASLAPVGSDIDPDIASHTVAVDIDISKLTVAPLSEEGLYPERKATPVPPAPDTSHLSVLDIAEEEQ